MKKLLALISTTFLALLLPAVAFAAESGMDEEEFDPSHEWMTEELKSEISRIIASRPQEDGLFVKWRMIWMGIWRVSASCFRRSRTAHPSISGRPISSVIAVGWNLRASAGNALATSAPGGRNRTTSGRTHRAASGRSHRDC